MCSDDTNADDTVMTFTCPICLGEISFQPTQPRTKSDNPQDKAVIISDNKIDDQNIRTSSPREDDNTNTSTNSITTYQNASSIYELKSCHHNFCTVCLRAYIRSKISDCVVDIPCCHFKLSTSDDNDDDDNDDFHLCNELIEEEDIYNLIHAKGIREDDASKTHDWCCQDTHNTSCTSIDDQTRVIEEANTKGEDIALWTKYQKIKFDKVHGKDCVRRCPKCDEATLFDENSMKLYQCTYLSLAAGVDATSANDSDGDMTRLQRMYHAFRQRKQSGEEIDSVLEDTAEVAEQVSSLHGEEDQETPNSSEQCTLVKSTDPNVTCNACNTNFCYFHANAHCPGKAACIEYHAKSIEDDRANVDYANNILRAKPCPNCGIPVSKESGCNQMKCSACGTHFCWLCSAIVDDGAFPEHFRWWNLKGCANLQLDENGSQGSRILAKIMSVLQIIVLGPPALALTLVTILLCPCFVPGCGRSNRERLINMVSFWGSFLSSMLFLPFTCIGLLIVTALYCFIATLLLCVKGCKRLPHEGANESNNTPSGGGDSSTGMQMSNEDLVRHIIFRMEEGTLQVTEEEGASGPELE